MKDILLKLKRIVDECGKEEPSLDLNEVVNDLVFNSESYSKALQQAIDKENK